MSDQEKVKSTTEAEDLLSDFGAAPKKAPSKPEPKVTPEPIAEPTPTVVSEQEELSPPSPKNTERKTASTASHSRAKAKNANQKTSDKKGKQTKQTARATASAGKGKQERTQKDDSRPRSKKTIHRIIPYVLGIVAIYIGLSLVLNLFCNPGNILQDTPSDHYMGLLGYYICETIFGVFGPAAFVLPLLLCNLAIFWRKFADNRVIISKILTSLLFLIMLGAVIHTVCLEDPRLTNKDLTTAQLFESGAKMTGGGVVGGTLGYLCYYSMSMLGSIIVGVFVLLVSLFYTLGTTPERIKRYFRESRRAKHASIEEGVEENAKISARRTSTHKSLENTEERTEPEKPKRSKEDRMAPMPLPQLDPGNDTRPFIPSDVNRKLHEAQRQAEAEATAKAIAEANEPKSTPQPPVQPINPAKNRDAAIDPIFPKTGEFKQVRKVPKEDRNFDLRNVFMDFEEDEQPKTPRAHAPVPPEVPLNTASRTVQKPTAASQKATQAAAAKPAVATPTQAVGQTVQKPVVQKPTPIAQKPVAQKVTQPIIKAAEVTHTDYGLSAEEFEKREAGQIPLSASKPKSASASAKPLEKPAQKSVSVKAEEPKKYVFPPISYLRAGEPMTAENKAEIEANSAQLTNTLANFRVGVEEVNYSYGPTVTRYELVLSPGVRVRSVLNLADDIALALRSSGGVRIEAPIPGTNAVGIEVPNKTRNTIYLRDLIESKEFAEASGKLNACLGAGIAGESLIFDIAKMPHLLIAGTTGSGKSVCINCIIVSLLYRVRPDEVKLVLIDPKKVEFSIYKNIPHLMAPVVTTPKDAAGALQAAVEEMERRFELFESVGVRDLKGYSAATANDPDMPKIPHMVIIIDELADLMMTAKNEVETAICRIAQKARAAGMHLIIGTQRPSADVVTGLIKANVPSCIAFAVKSQVDSRVILDHGGAEALTGRGDMLFVPIGSMRDTRVQGAFVDDKEVERICEFLRATNGTAQYDERFNAKLKELAAQCGKSAKAADDVPLSADGEKGDDPKYADAVRVAVEEKRISTSLLQRKLEVGYSRAAKLVDRMEAEGIVSPPDGSKPRSVLISNEEYIERFMMSNDEND